MDGKFVKNKSLNFDFKIPKGKKYEAHLMVKNPYDWIKKNYKKVDKIIFHIESTKTEKEILEILNFLKKKKKKIGIAINPRTKIEKITPYLNDINLVTIMTVIPGKYGAKFIPKPLQKIKTIKAVNKQIKIEVDGGINIKTIKFAKDANYFIIGSYLQKSNNPEQNYKKLKKEVKK